MDLACPAQISQPIRGRAKFLVVGVGVSWAGSTRAAGHPHPERQRLGPASSPVRDLGGPVQAGDVPPSPLAPPVASRGRRRLRSSATSFPNDAQKIRPFEPSARLSSLFAGRANGRKNSHTTWFSRCCWGERRQATQPKSSAELLLLGFGGGLLGCGRRGGGLLCGCSFGGGLLGCGFHGFPLVSSSTRIRWTRLKYLLRNDDSSFPLF